MTVVEQNAADATFGFGVVFSHGALEFLARDAPAMHATLVRVMETWPMQRIVHRDEAVDIDGNGFCAIGRLELLRLLQAECARAGIVVVYRTTVTSFAPFAGCDLVVGADGVNSFVRKVHAEAFRPAVEWLTNRFVWYGTTQRFDCLTLTFRANEHGAFVAHHYRYGPARSTFIVECDAATWQRAGFAAMDDAASRAYCERLFAPDLDGHPLVSNRSQWRNFPLLTNARWSAGNVVLIGDALRTGHFSIGSGTRLAFDDAIALARALAEAGDDVPRLVAAFERERRPVVEKLVAAANSSSFWYERMADKMALSPVALAYDYMTRSGRIRDERLAEMAPKFMARVQAERAREADAAPVDPVPDDAPGAVEIGFAVPARYNASALLYDNLPSRAGKVAVLCGERSLTYGELCALADRAGNGLARMGLARGGRVLMLLDDGPEYAAAIFGAIRAGFVPVLVNTLSPPELVAYLLQDTGAEAALVDARFAGLLAHADVAASRLRHVVHVGGIAARASPELATHHDWNAWVDAQAATLVPADTHRDDMAFWMYSSGSTGRPKGVRPPAARRAVHARRVRPRRHRHRPGRRRVLAAQDLLRLRLRQLADVSVRGRRDDRADAGQAGPGGGVRDDRAASAHRAVRPADAVRRDGRASGVARARPVEPAARGLRRRDAVGRALRGMAAPVRPRDRRGTGLEPKCSTSTCRTRRCCRSPAPAAGACRGTK